MIIEDLRSAFNDTGSVKEDSGAASQTPEDVLIPRNRGVLQVKDFAGRLSTMSMTEYDNPLYNWFSTILDSSLQTVQIVIAMDPAAPELRQAWRTSR